MRIKAIHTNNNQIRTTNEAVRNTDNSRLIVEIVMTSFFPLSFRGRIFLSKAFATLISALSLTGNIFSKT